MSRLRYRIELMFEQFARVVYDHRLKVLCLVMLVIGGMAAGIPGVAVDTSTEGFLHAEDPILLDYEAFRDQFGRDEMAVVALEPDNVFDLGFLKKLKALHEDLEENLPFLDDITSLINARNTYGDGDELIVDDLLEEFPQTGEALRNIEQRARGNEMYRNLLLPEAGGLTTIIIKTHTYSGQTGSDETDLTGFGDTAADVQAGNAAKPVYLTDRENSIFVRALEEIVQRHRSPEFKIHIAGTPVVTDFLKRTMIENMRQFLAIAVITIGLFLLIMFRRLSGLLMPLFIVMVSLLSTIGLMAHCGIAVKLPTQILPSFLLAVAVGASVHILVIFFQEYDRKAEKRESIARALGHSGLAVVMTSLTTAGGLLSFSTAEVAPVADLGRFAAAGVLFSLVYTLTLLPALLALFPVKSKQGVRRSGNATGIMDTVLDFCFTTSTQYPRAVLGIGFLLFLVGIAGAARIQLSHDPVRWLPDHSDVRLATEFLDRELKGTTSLEIILDTGTENGLYDPDLLQRLERSSHKMEAYSDEQIVVGKAWSLTSVLKETNQALHENRQEYYTIPDNRDLIAQEFFLFENSGSDDLEDLTDSRFSKARFTMKLPFIDSIAYAGFMDTALAHFTLTFPGQAVKMTGMVAMLARVLRNTIHSMLESYAYALTIITLLMILLIGKFRIGLFSMIPNIFPIVLMLGLMGWAGLPMDLFCMMVGSIAIGLAVDDTIHFMHNFRRYFDMHGDARKAVHLTLHTTGRAMLVTTCVLSIGFFTFMFSEMNNLFNFGLLTGFALFMALMADYFIAPALMVLLNKKNSADTSTQTDLQDKEAK